MALSDPASGPQVGYIIGLARQLKDVIKDDETTSRLERVAKGEQLSKGDASLLIEAMKGALMSLRGNGPFDPQPAYTPTQMDIDTRRFNEERRERVHTWNDRQARAFIERHGSYGPVEPPKSKKDIVIWQRTPHVMRKGWSGEGDVDYGWAWRCTHRAHDHRPTKYVQGSSLVSIERCRENAAAHWEKYHAFDEMKRKKERGTHIT